MAASYHTRSNSFPQDRTQRLQKLKSISLANGHQKKKWVDELLNGSFMILDVCSTAQNALLQMKESTLGIRSLLCKRRDEEN
ncbi:hypothetical protein WN943_007028 [Citrus x changshan-huyou]